jgi:hypothetical protein
MQASSFGATGVRVRLLVALLEIGARAKTRCLEAGVGLTPGPLRLRLGALNLETMSRAVAAVGPHAHSATCWVPSNQRLERSVTDLVARRLTRHKNDDRAERQRLSHAAAQARR